jgi:sugar phosphate permease
MGDPEAGAARERGREPGKATRVRYVVLAFTFLLSVITYIDRVCISAAAPTVSAELGLSRVQMGLVFSAFTLAYALMEVPSGWWGDLVGARRVLTRIVVWWSLFTALTGAAWSFLSLAAFRFLFGAGEAGAFPNCARIFSRWMPATQRGLAHGIIFTGSRLGGSLTPYTVVALLAAVGWRRSFGIFGTLGLVWAVAFYAWFRDDPAQKPAVNAAELELIRAGPAVTATGRPRVPWRALLTSVNLWAICLMYGCMFYGWYFYITWLPTYLREARGLSAERSGLYSSLPLLFGAAGCVLGGLLTDALVARRGLKFGRRTVGVASLVAAACFLAASLFLRDPAHAILAVSLSAFSNDFALSACWAVCVDTGREFAGTVSGCMNTFGNLGGALSPFLVGIFLERFHSWNLALDTACATYLLGALLWLRIDPTEPVLERPGGGRQPAGRPPSAARR